MNLRTLGSRLLTLLKSAKRELMRSCMSLYIVGFTKIFEIVSCRPGL